MYSSRKARQLGTQRQLFLDDDIVDELNGMKRRLGGVEKYRGNPVITAEHSWERNHPYLWGTVLYDARQGYRVWYLRRDGFDALEVGQIGRDAYVRTKHFTFRGRTLRINVDSASFGGGRGVAQVEFVEPDDTPIPGFTRQDCDLIVADSTHHTVTWRGNLDVSSLQGRLVRFKFYCRTTRLYSFWFEP